jgi:hypothetical protein
MEKANLCITAYGSGVVRTASSDSGLLQNKYARGCVVAIDMTAVPGVDTVTFTLEGQDGVSGKWYTIIASTAIVAVSTVLLRAYPGLTASANAVVSDVLPCAFRVRATHSAASNFTYTVGVQLEL